jgi:hypothetical protein
MEMNLIDQYINNYEIFRELNTWDSLKFDIDGGESEIAKQIKRYKLGVGLFNKLNLKEDYDFVSFMFDQELQLRKSNIGNQNPDVLYLYAFFLSRFKQIEDVWKFVEAKYIDFDSGIGFDTHYLLTFGIDEIYSYASTTQNDKKELLIRTIGNKKEDIHYDQNEFERWEKGKYEYYDFVKPIKRPLNFYQLFDHKEFYKDEFKEWLKGNEINDERNAYDCIHMAEYADDKETLTKAIEIYLKHNKEGFLHDKFKNRLSELKMNKRI